MGSNQSVQLLEIPWDDLALTMIRAVVFMILFLVFILKRKFEHLAASRERMARRVRHLSPAFACEPNDHYDYDSERHGYDPDYTATVHPDWSVHPVSSQFFTPTFCWVTSFYLETTSHEAHEYPPCPDAELALNALKQMRGVKRLIIIFPDVRSLTAYYPGCYVDDGPPYDADVFCKVMVGLLERMPALPDIEMCCFSSTETVRRLRPAPFNRSGSAEEPLRWLTRDTDVVDIVRLPLGEREPHLLDFKLNAGVRI